MKNLSSTTILAITFDNKYDNKTPSIFFSSDYYWHGYNKETYILSRYDPCNTILSYLLGRVIKKKE